MNKDYSFYLVYDATAQTVIARYPTIHEAYERAQYYCKANLGSLVTVMSIQKAFRAKAAVDEEYLYSAPIQKTEPEPAYAPPMTGPDPETDIKAVEYEL